MARTLIVLATALSLTVGVAAADVIDQTATINGMRVEYKVVRPRNFDRGKTCETEIQRRGDRALFL